MMFLSTFVALAAIVSSALATPIEIVERAAVPPKDKVYIQSVNYAGTGCPAGSVAVSMGADLSNINLAFDSYFAEIGPQVTSPAKTRKNCNVNFNVVFPEGYTYTIFSTDYMGYVKLDPKVTALQKSTYYFTGYEPRFDFWSSWVGPVNEDYYFKDDLDVQSWVWSPCGYKSTLNVNTQIRLENSKNKTGSGLITMDSMSHKVTHKLHLSWKKCPK